MPFGKENEMFVVWETGSGCCTALCWITTGDRRDLCCWASSFSFLVFFGILRKARAHERSTARLSMSNELASA